MFPIFAGNSAATGYNLTRSLRFRSSASAYLNRTPASAGNRQTWTWSAWVKRGLLGASLTMLDGGATGPLCDFEFQSNDTIRLYITDSGISTSEGVVTTAVFRDPSAWYHIMCVLDTTQATVANRVKIYVNNVQQTITGLTGTLITQNSNQGMNRAVATNIGRYSYVPQNYFDGYLTEVNFIDGQALTPSSFGSTNALTGVWQPARYTGTYGTNGFYLPFTDNSALTTSSNVGLGKDFSGNGNYWTTNNISITAGVTYDSMTDVPTLTSATAANFAVANPLSVGANTALTNGNLTGTLTGSGGWSATICGLTSGKWYYEATVTANSGNSMWIGFLSDVYTLNNNGWSFSTQTALYANDARNGNNASYGATWTTNDVIGVAIDLSTSSGSITFYKNGTSQGVMFSSLTTSAVWRPLVSGGGTGTTIAMNFGQRPFSYTPPTGYVALNTYNLPTSTIVKGNTVMDATIWTGADTATSRSFSGLAFKPDFWWNKPRSQAYSNLLYDSVRGAGSTKELSSNSTTAEGGTNAATYGYLSSFDSNGVTWTRGSAGSGANPDGYADYDESGATYVAWAWQAGQGSSSSNTNGTITSTVSVNASAGFSVVTYTGTNTGTPSPMPTVGHGLGVAPSLVISKSRNLAGVDSGAWFVWTSAQATDNYLRLNTTAASASISGGGGGTMVAPTSSVFSTPYVSGSNINANNYVAYCWTPIAGYSSFGSYTGNGSSDGPFVYTGFRPKFVMIKRTDSTGIWYINDSSRDTYNVVGLDLSPNSSSAESNDSPVQDFLSNGFKLRNGSYTSFNASGGTYIYMAFAENPFKNALAR